jgi:hypothetical protein
VLDKTAYFEINKQFVHRLAYTASGIQIALVNWVQKAKQREHLDR